MATTYKHSANGELTAAYRDYEVALRIKQARLAYFLGVFLIPAGWMLDYFVYPSLLWTNLNLRLFSCVLLIPWWLLTFTKWGARHARILDKPCTIIPTLIICAMIYESEGAVSPYYAGLNFVLVGACLVVPYTFREGAWFTAFLMVVYTLSCFWHRVHPPAGALHHVGAAITGSLAANLYFLFGQGMICAAACHYRFLRRFDDFRLRHELDVNNHELEETLTKLKNTEVQLVQSEKMNALGKLSAGLLHEINNPLNFTFMALQVAESEAAENASLKETLTDIGQGMTRIRSVISDLRAFAYPSELSSMESFSLDDAVTTAVRLTAHELGTIAVNRDGVKEQMALGTKTQVVHVLMNLLVNSAHALKDKSLGRTPEIVIKSERKNDRMEVSIRDNGCGVKPKDLPRLLEPFFTTKQPGEGTGLGLSICHTIVKNHGGDVRIASEEGQWTCVTFDLPAPQAQRAAA